MELSEDACEAKLALDDQIREYKKSRRDPEYILGNIDMAQVIFEDLSMLTMHHFGRCYILLADEYDVPFITVHQSHWSTAQQQDAISTLQSLFGFMFKDNMSLEKGLMVGVIPVSLSDLGSGVNNFSDVTTVPTEQNDLDLIALLGPPEYPLSSIDELVNSFGFDYSEIRYIAQIVFTPYSYLRNQIDDVMQSIRQWYNGYQLYRFGGKYNPWSLYMRDSTEEEWIETDSLV
ncbi:hypothetical protein H4217_002342 [Coemansia sp. RSA 1939]|nr:hypothetical protein H4217_002342 [Coemansia sp. RSA 1939]